MGTIVSRQRKDKTTAFMAKISIMRDGKIVHRENKTFDRKQAAAAWIVKREEELSKPGEIDRANADRLTLADAIDKYVGENVRPIGRTKAQVLKTTKTFHIASMDCAAIKSQHIVEFATELGRSRKPQTVGNYLSHLSSIFAIARPAWNVDLDYQAMKDAQVVLKRLGIIKSSDKNERRPTLEEMNRIMAHYDDRELNQPLLAPMRHIIAFALFSTRRQDEIMRIRWEDFDAEGKRVLVRDMKNPGEKFGNDVWCDLPDPACDIIKAMPKVRDEIFPYNAASISASFTRTCNLLEIDIDFHRLRHEGISRLFEMGAGIPQAAAVSGHRSWTSLKRYAHIRQTGDKYADWPWIKEVVKPARAGSRPLSKRTKRSRGLPVD